MQLLKMCGLSKAFKTNTQKLPGKFCYVREIFKN